MRAIVLLCLLHAAFGQLSNSWYGPDHVDIDLDPNKDSACQTDQGSCGCCLMVKQIHSLRTYFNESLNMLEKQYSLTYQNLYHIKTSRSAFSVALTSESNLKCFGPFRDDRLITYQHIFINLGDGYSPETGVFTVPHSGVYSLALTIYSDAGSPGNTLAACARLQVNGQVVAGPGENNKQDQEDSSTIVIALHLTAGDKVAVNLPVGCFLCDDSSHYNTFSAFLLYLTE